MADNAGLIIQNFAFIIKDMLFVVKKILTGNQNLPILEANTDDDFPSNGIFGL